MSEGLPVAMETAKSDISSSSVEGMWPSGEDLSVFIELWSSGLLFRSTMFHDADSELDVLV